MNTAQTTEGKDYFREALNKIYDDGFAVIQYSIGRYDGDFEGYLARHRECLYEIRDKVDLESYDDTVKLRKVPIATILSLPNTKKLKG